MSQVVGARPVAFSLPFRLRTAFGVLLLAAVVVVAVPRMRAAWRLYGVVGKVADYGLCMAGPAGADAIRGDTARFRQLVRRRLTAADANDRPFAHCAKLATSISDHPETGDGYDQPASDFLEWGGGGQRLSVNGLLRVMPDLVLLRAQSWPLARKPLSELMRPTRGAYEGEHPSELALPGLQRGLAMDSAIVRSTTVTPKGYYVVLSNERDTWAFRSRDQGRNWASTSAWQDSLEGHAHHCVANAEGTRFALAPARAGASPALQTGTVGGSYAERFEFGSPSDVPLRVACDEAGAVVMTRSNGEHRLRVFSCAVALGCHEIALPPVLQQKDVFVDVARAARAVCLVWSRDGLVRVTTARDPKPTLSGSELVFDARSTNVQGLHSVVVPSLLGFGKQLMLTLSAPGGAARWALVSNGAGAGFHGI